MVFSVVVEDDDDNWKMLFFVDISFHHVNCGVMKGFPVQRKAALRRNSVSTRAYVLFSIYLCSLRIIITCVVGKCRLYTAEV